MAWLDDVDLVGLSTGRCRGSSYLRLVGAVAVALSCAVAAEDEEAWSGPRPGPAGLEDKQLLVAKERARSAARGEMAWPQQPNGNGDSSRMSIPLRDNHGWFPPSAWTSPRRVHLWDGAMPDAIAEPHGALRRRRSINAATQILTPLTALAPCVSLVACGDQTAATSPSRQHWPRPANYRAPSPCQRARSPPGVR